MTEKPPVNNAIENRDPQRHPKTPASQADEIAADPKSRGHKIPVSVLDKRRVSKESEVSAAIEPDTKPLYVQQLEERVKRVETGYKQKVEELQEETRRSRERLFQDLEKRFQERERALLLELLELVDDLDRACALTASEPSVAQGLSVIASRAEQILKAHGCLALRPEGEPFDPNRMEAVGLKGGPADTVVGVLQPGYLQGNEVLRAARVFVGDGKSCL